MKNWKLSLFVVAASLFTGHVAVAQAPAGAPAGATGLCNDGSYTTKTLKFTSCTGHKGVKAWYASSTKPATATSTTTATTTTAAPASTTASTTAAPAKSASVKSSSKVAKTVAAGGGPGLVWLNTKSNVYHCYGGDDYGTTKAGKYLTEDAAKSAGGRAAGGKACTGK